jgi:hypothetical protein
VKTVRKNDALKPTSSHLTLAPVNPVARMLRVAGGFTTTRRSVSGPPHPEHADGVAELGALRVQGHEQVAGGVLGASSGYV